MRKRSVISVLLMLIMVVAMMGCGKKTPAIVGKWTAAKMEIAGVSVDLEEFAKQAGDEGSALKITMDVKEDKTVIMDNDGETENGTWKENGDKFTVTVDNESQDVTVQENELVFEMDMEGQTAKIIFTKEK